MAIPVYKEVKPHKAFLNYVRKWTKSRKMEIECFLISRPNLIVAVRKNMLGSSLICFYIQKLCSLGVGGVIVYHDLESMHSTLKNNVEDTFGNWIAQAHLNTD